VIVGIGVDLCEIARIARALDGPTGTRFRARVFTEGEQAYCEGRRRGRFESYAARFAAKEAAMKALGTGWAQGVSWHDFEVASAEGEGPRLLVHGRAAAIARTAGVARWHLALSHSTTTAVAWVIAER
jgi:holo-[acyl-carrier protein] synthase